MITLKKILIAYDTVSPSRVTETVAVTIGQILKGEKLHTDTIFAADVAAEVVTDYCCLLVGAPTMAFRASKGIMQFLNGLASLNFSGKIAAAFDTQMQSRLSGSAVKGIEGKLRDLRFRIVSAPLVAYVKAGPGKNEWRLKEGEIDKTKEWAHQISESLLKLK